MITPLFPSSPPPSFLGKRSYLLTEIALYVKSVQCVCLSWIIQSCREFSSFKSLEESGLDFLKLATEGIKIA